MYENNASQKHVGAICIPLLAKVSEYLIVTSFMARSYLHEDICTAYYMSWINFSAN